MGAKVVGHLAGSSTRGRARSTADMLFELISRRHLRRSTVDTTNRRFADWGEVFLNAGPSALPRSRRLAGARSANEQAFSSIAHTGGTGERRAAALDPRQALAVFECLQALRQALRAVYGSRVQQAWCEQLMSDSQPPEFDSNEPF